MAIDIEKLKATLPRLDLSRPYQPSDIQSEYFDFYDINFSEQIPAIAHFFGTLDCSLFDQTSADIAVHYFKNENAVGTCIVVHGFTDHVGIFGQLINYLLHRGQNVIAFDLPGHGLSDGDPLHIDDFASYGLVLDRIIDVFAGQVAKPLHIFGQSMGGAIVMDYLLSNQFEAKANVFDRVVLLAPLVRPAKWRSIRIASLLLSPVLGSVKRSFTQSSNDREFLQFLEHDDPLQARRIPTSWVRAMLRWVSRFKKLSWSNKQVLVIQGLQDETVDFRHGLGVIKNKFPQSKVFKIKEARHHLVGEDELRFERVVNAADMYFERRRSPR